MRVLFSKFKTTLVLLLVAVFTSGVITSCSTPEKSENEATDSLSYENPNIEEGIHTPTGLKDDENLMLVVGTCTACHSAKLVTQNRATRDGWKNLIVWMQETQKLWDLGENEEKILDYLEKHYAPELKTNRRPPLAVEEWYELESE